MFIGSIREKEKRGHYLFKIVSDIVAYLYTKFHTKADMGLRCLVV